MRKLVLALLAIIIIGAGVFFFFFNDDKKEGAGKELQALAISEENSAFNASFTPMLNAYYAMKDAFVAADTAQINLSALDLIQKTESLNVEEIRGDSSGLIRETAGHFAATIIGSARGIMGEQDIEEKRRELEIISDALWSLTRTVKYDGQKIYYQFCPMAFDDKGAYWLSSSSAIRNPYFGDKMLTCGTVQDSIDYSVR